VNGGEHGLVDRQNRYDRCRSMGERILALVNDQGDDMPLVNGPSLSAYRDDDKPIGFGTEVDRLNQAMLLDLDVERMAERGEAASLEKVRRVAEGRAPVHVEDFQVERAKIVLDSIEKK
jgi:hypothetical protein